MKIEDGSSFYITDENTLVTIEIWDKDGLSKDDFMGKCVLPLKSFISGGVHCLMDKTGRPVKEKSNVVIQIL